MLSQRYYDAGSVPEPNYKQMPLYWAFWQKGNYQKQLQCSYSDDIVNNSGLSTEPKTDSQTFYMYAIAHAVFNKKDKDISLLIIIPDHSLRLVVL